MLQVYNEYKKAHIKQLILQKRQNTKHIFCFFIRENQVLYKVINS